MWNTCYSMLCYIIFISTTCYEHSVTHSHLWQRSGTRVMILFAPTFSPRTTFLTLELMILAMISKILFSIQTSMPSAIILATWRSKTWLFLVFANMRCLVLASNTSHKVFLRASVLFCSDRRQNKNNRIWQHSLASGLHHIGS